MRCYLDIISGFFFWTGWDWFISPCSVNNERTCVRKRGKQFYFTPLLEQKSNPSSPHTFSTKSLLHILIVSICYSWSVSTRSDARTCEMIRWNISCRRGISVSRCWIYSHLKRKQLLTNASNLIFSRVKHLSPLRKLYTTHSCRHVVSGGI